MFIIYCFFLFLASISSAFAKSYPVIVGNSTVLIQTQYYGKGKAFVHLHQNETTALQAARAVIKKQGGSLLTIVHSGQRNIIFKYHKKRYEFDPNRIFTDKGIKKTLMQFGDYSLGAHREVKKLATKIKQLLPKGKIIAVHNNESYSLRNYFPGQTMFLDAGALYFNTTKHYRNFYLVTQKNDYLRLKKLNFNSVLQALNAKDDGSLSVYLSKRAYVNVEAGYDQFRTQVTMLTCA